MSTEIETTVTGNPFVERNRLILRLDMAARSEELQSKLEAAPEWDTRTPRTATRFELRKEPELLNVVTSNLVGNYRSQIKKFHQDTQSVFSLQTQ